MSRLGKKPMRLCELPQRITERIIEETIYFPVLRFWKISCRLPQTFSRNESSIMSFIGQALYLVRASPGGVPFITTSSFQRLESGRVRLEDFHWEGAQVQGVINGVVESTAQELISVCTGEQDAYMHHLQVIADMLKIVGLIPEDHAQPCSTKDIV